MQDYREDFLPIRATVDPETGYLTDTPVLARTGVYSYTNPRTGKVEKEYRPASVVFHADHLRALKGKPIVVAHTNGLLSSKNVSGVTVGAILSEGRQDGDNLVADIIVHDTSPIMRDGMRELSLGYLVDVDDTPGMFNGERYDRSLTRINSVNHLAIVRKGRAGVARFNMDQQDTRMDFLNGDSAASARARMIANVTRQDTAVSAARMDDAQHRIDSSTVGDYASSAARARRAMIEHSHAWSRSSGDPKRLDDQSSATEVPYSAASARARMYGR